MVTDLSILSRVTSHALRHEPWLYELELDNEGWTSVKSLIAALSREQPAWVDLSEGDLVRMINSSDKRRHELHDGRIRAIYGHSIAGNLKHSPATPPELLYLGTAPEVVSLISSSGLLPMGRQYAHLSVDEATVTEVGKRKAKSPKVLCILARNASDSGVIFYEGNDKVWLANFVPPDFIVFPGEIA